MLKWNCLCRQCQTKTEQFSDNMQFGDMCQCETCHEEMRIVSINGFIEGNMLYRNIELDKEEIYDKLRGFAGLKKTGEPKAKKAKVTIK